MAPNHRQLSAHPPGRGPDPADSDEALARRFMGGLQQAPYFSAGRLWDDYLPAYRLGQRSRRRFADERFEDVEPCLAQEWAASRGDSRLGWVEARGAVEDAFSRDADDPADPAPAGGSWHFN